jgi:hypothetical protein
MRPCARWPGGWLFQMSDPRQEGISWQDLPRERRRRLLVLIGLLIGLLIRQRLAAPSLREASDERDPATNGSAADRQGPGPPP